MRRFLATLLAASLAFTNLVGCASKGCLSICTVGVSLTVRNAATTEAICDATVTLTNRPSAPRIEPFVTEASATPCSYPVDCSGAGTYEFQVSKAGFRSVNTTVVVPGREGCPASDTQFVQVDLPASP